ncbi:MAG: hypothetical protein WBS18_07870 [Candidatus Acidiferrales bacterium]
MSNGNSSKTDHHEGEPLVNVHTAGSPGEALVIRGLLESEGVLSAGPGTSDPFPLSMTPEGTHGVEVYVLESQAKKAAKIIEEHLTKSGQAAESDLTD